MDARLHDPPFVRRATLEGGLLATPFIVQFLILHLGAMGEVHTTTCRAFAAAEMGKIVAKVRGGEVKLGTRRGLMDELDETKTPGYSHTQRAPVCLILYGVAIYSISLGWFIGDTLGMCVAGGVGLLVASLAPCFHHLTVQDQGDVLEIRFGPIPLFRRTVRYADIKTVEIGRTLILDGWGIHLSIRGGWVWNLWGRDCVVIHFTKGVLRIGTNDTANLAEFLNEKISERKT